jgi:hypothetical protein
MKRHWIVAALIATAPLAGCATDNSADDEAGPTSGPGGGDGGSIDTGGSDSGGTGGDEGGAGGVGGTGGGPASSSSSSGGSGGTGLVDCGNDVIDEGEQCDGPDFGGKDCLTFGLGSGSLVCNPYCGIVVSSCKPKESCNDSVDNDTDGTIDCDDTDDCLMAATCQDSCTPTKSASIPAYVNATTEGRPNVHSASCNGGGSGNEIVYEVTAPTTGDLAVTLYSWTGADFSLSVRTECGTDTSEIACENDKVGSDFEPETLSLPVTMGTKYFVMVEGIDANNTGQFDLQIYMPLPESDFSCSDLSDNDADGYLDCDDATACQPSSYCTPGAKAAGQPCFGQSECFSANNDPICLLDWQGYPGGYCTQFCDVAAPDCTGDSLCKQVGISKNGVCLDGCVSNGDCRPGYACSEQGLATKVCTLAPEGGFAGQCSDYQDNDKDNLIDCDDPFGCQATAECASGPQANGKVCTVHNQCAATGSDPFCVSQSQFFWQGGYCSQFCSIAAQDCGAGSICADPNAIIWVPSQNGICFKTCASPADCEPGYQCNDFFGSFSVPICHW